MIRTTLLVLFCIAAAGTASASELIYKSKTPTGYAWVLERGGSRQVPCYRTIRTVKAVQYMRNRECDYPAESMSDIAIPMQSSARYEGAQHFRILPNDNIKLY